MLAVGHVEARAAGVVLGRCVSHILLGKRVPEEIELSAARGDPWPKSFQVAGLGPISAELGPHLADSGPNWLDASTEFRPTSVDELRPWFVGPNLADSWSNVAELSPEFG